LQDRQVLIDNRGKENAAALDEVKKFQIHLNVIFMETGMQGD
jgi:hypothetical protein